MHTHAILSVALKPAALLEALCGALAEAGSVRSLLCILPSSLPWRTAKAKSVAGSGVQCVGRSRKRWEFAVHTHAILSVALKPAALLEALCGALAEAGSVRSLLCILPSSLAWRKRCWKRLAKTIETHRENQSKIEPWRCDGAPEIDAKSLPGPSRDTPWRPRASRRRLGSVSGASWSVPGVPRERPEALQGRPGTPERAPGSARERAEATKIDSKSRPRAKKTSFFRAAHSRTLFGSIFRRFSSIVAPIFVVFRGYFVRASRLAARRAEP